MKTVNVSLTTVNILRLLDRRLSLTRTLFRKYNSEVTGLHPYERKVTGEW